MKTWQRWLRLPVILFIVFALLAESWPSAAQKPTPLPANIDPGAAPPGEASAMATIRVVNTGWTTSSSTSDCAQGWGVDTWELVLSQPKMVRIAVSDCCCPGDYYGVYVNGVLLGTTPRPAVWGCGQSGTLSSGSFQIVLPAGTHTIRIRDASFADHTADEIGRMRMCPAGFTVTGTLSAPPALPDVTVDSASWNLYHSRSPYLPEDWDISVVVRNIGVTNANNVVVRFYGGNPDAGAPQIGADRSLGAIPAGGQATATVQWVLGGYVENLTLYARAFVASDSNPNNNTSSKTVSIWYVPFRHDGDAYSFENWALEAQDVINNLMAVLDVTHPDAMQQALAFPILYPIFTSLMEGGHCYGMAATSCLYSLHPEIKPAPISTYALGKEQARSDIQHYQHTQTAHVIDAMFSSGNVQAEYDKLRVGIRDRHEPIMLLMSGSDGRHAVLAYEILDLGAEKRVYLYDNNYIVQDAAANCYATINTRNATFHYVGFPYIYDQFIARRPMMTWPDSMQDWMDRLYRWALDQVRRSGVIRVFLAPTALLGGSSAADSQGGALPGLPAELLVTDQQGRRVGRLGGRSINEIPGALMSMIGSELVLDLPAHLRYTVRSTGTASGMVNLSILVPESGDVVRDVGYSAVPVTAGAVATLRAQRGNQDWTLQNTEQPARQPDAIRDTRFLSSFLPAVARGTFCGGETIVNGGFEQGGAAGWAPASARGRNLFYQAGAGAPVAPHSGRWLAWLGNAHNEVSSLTQTVMPPAGATSATLSYWYWINSSEGACTYDHAWVEINGGLLKLHDLCSGGNTSGWRQVSIGVTPYLGTPITVRFYLDTDASVLSHLYLDDVSLVVTCAR